MAKQRYHLINTFFEVAKSAGLSAPEARRELAAALGRPALAEYRAIWDYLNGRAAMPADMIKYMMNYCIYDVVKNSNRDSWAERLSPP